MQASRAAMISGAVGVASRKLLVEALGAPAWLAAGFAVGAAIASMGLTRTTHPPGGAFALIAVVGGPRVVEAGWAFVLVPGAPHPWT